MTLCAPICSPTRLGSGSPLTRGCAAQACQSIYPLKDVYIRKVKTLKAPKFDITKLMEVRIIHSPPPSPACPKTGA